MKIDRSLLTYTDEYELKDIKAVVIHNTANPDTCAENNAIYLRSKGLGYHFIVDIDGTIYQLQTLKKRAIHCGGRKYTAEATKFFGKHYAPDYYHTAEHQHNGSPNSLTLGICYCYIDKSGKPTDATYKSICKLLSLLCLENKLKYNGGIWRHFDVTGKKCPNYFVNNDNFVKLIHDVANKMLDDTGYLKYEK